MPFYEKGDVRGGPFAFKLMEWAPELCARRPDVSMETIDAYLHNLYRVQPDFVYSVPRDFARSCQTPMRVMPPIWGRPASDGTCDLWHHAGR